jgi:polysaccharide biosynthesis transport protein
MATSFSPEEFDPKKYLRALRRRWLVALLTTLGTIGLAGFAARTKAPTYESFGELLIESDRKSSLTGVGGKIGTLESLKREATPLDTQALVLRSSPLRSQVIEELHLKDPKTGQPLDPTKLLIDVEVVVGSDVLRVKYKDPDQHQASAVINRLMAAYISQNRQLNNTEATSAKSFIERELPPAKAELDRAALALESYRSANQIVALERESASTVEMLQRLTEQIYQVEAQMAEADAQQAVLQGQITQPAAHSLQSAALSQTPAIQTALTELRQAQTKLDAERARYRSDHPNVQILEREVASLRGRLSQRIGEVVPVGSDPVTAGQLSVSPLEQKMITDAAQLQVRQQGLIQQLAALREARDSLSDRRSAMPSFVKNEEALKQQLDLAQKQYSILRNKQSEIQLAEIQSVTNARIIQPALTPLTASNKTRNLLLLAGTGTGLCLGIAAAFTTDMLARPRKTPDA